MNLEQDWMQEFKTAFKSSDELSLFLGLKFDNKVSQRYPLFVTQGLAQRIKELGADSKLAKQFLPDSQELKLEGAKDPIGDHDYLVAPKLIHRYHNRVLFLPLTNCPVNCRYCFRKNELTPSDDLFKGDFQLTLDYLKQHPEVEELIFTGGDPFVLSDEKIDFYLQSFATISHLKFIRFHTRTPVVMPSRLTTNLKNILEKWAHHFQFLQIVLHTNHVEEWSEAVEEKIKSFYSPSIPWLAQTVLLKDINDTQEDLLALINKLLSLKIRPYYLHHPDQVMGGMHFTLPLETGRKLYAKLRDKLPGWALPQYVIDAPNGHGKVSAFNPETYAFSGQLIDRSGEIRSLQVRS